MIAEYITKEELQRYLTLEDTILNLQYQELRDADSRFYVREVKETIRTSLNPMYPLRSREEVVTRYELLEDMNGQVRVVEHPVKKGHFLSFRTTVDAVELKIWIYGFLNGVRVTAKKLEEYHPKPKFAVGDLVKVVDADTMKKARKETDWAIIYGAENYCGRQFTVCYIRYSFSQNTHVYCLSSGFDTIWFREELLEAYKEEPK